MLHRFRKNPRRKPRIVIIRVSLAALATSLIAVTALLLVGRTPNRQWNTTRDESIRLFEETRSGLPYSISVVEIDDQGVMWDPQQLDWTLAHLHSVIETHPVGTIVQVFIHGWKQNARWRGNGSSRLDSFRTQLDRIASRVARSSDAVNPPGIVGVYIGWRGRSFSLPAFENVTFWNRRVAAHRAANLDLLEILLKLARLGSQYDEVKMVMVGHSMGGLILEKTLTPAIVTTALGPTTKTAPEPIGVDLVVSANPATSALDAHRLMEFFRRNDTQLVTVDATGRIELARGPIIVSLNSEADMVNRLSFPLGMWINSLFLKYRTDSSPDRPPQRRLGIRAAGHEPSIITHSVVLESGVPVLKGRSETPNPSPYWIVRLPKEISSGHSDVSNPRISRIIVDLMDLNRVFEPEIQLALSTRTNREETVLSRSSDASGPARAGQAGLR